MGDKDWSSSLKKGISHIYTLTLDYSKIPSQIYIYIKKKKQIHSIITISGSNDIRKGWNHI